MPRIIRIALCQLSSQPTVKEGFAKVDEVIADVSKQGANLAIFPEFFIQGIVQDAPHKIPDEGEWEQHVRDLAVKYEIDICIGTFAEKVQERGDADEDEQSQEKTYNTAYYFKKDGELVGKYRKRNLWHPEKDYLHSGQDDHLIFESSFCKTGMLVCWDLAWPEAFRALFMQGVELVVAPSYWVADDLTEEGRVHDPEAEGEMSWLDSLVITRAYENECVVAYVNCGGPASKGFLGRSAVAAPFKGCIGRTKGCEEEVKVVEVDLDVLVDARKVYKMKKDYINTMRNGGFGHPESLKDLVEN